MKIHCFGLDYDHPFGLAAGMDKKAEALRGWESIGLAFSEIGGVTMHEQGGNPKPRMFRHGPIGLLLTVWDSTIPVAKRLSQL